MLAETPTYVIGDVQGCHSALQALLAELPDVSTAQLWFAGDLINRGPQSLETLRLIRSLGERAICVLGNHDLHLLATVCGVRNPSPKDTLQEILNAPERNDLIDWLRNRPLAHLQNNILMVHAGVHPQWTESQTIELAQEVQDKLRSDQWHEFLAQMYGDTPKHWRGTLTGADRLRVIVNVLTRMRMLESDGGMDLDFKDGPTGTPDHLRPWFEFDNALRASTTLVFGHWSTLGLTLRPNHIGLDTGCVWGGCLSAVRLSDRAVFQVPCPQVRGPEPAPG